MHRLSARIVNVLFASGAHVVLCRVGPQKLASGSGLIKFLFRICRGWTVDVGGPCIAIGFIRGFKRRILIGVMIGRVEHGGVILSEVGSVYNK